MLTALRVLVLLFAALIAGALVNRRNRRLRARRLEEEWTSSKPPEPLDAEELADVRRHFEERSAAAPPDAAAPVDEITWNDLEMDSIFAMLNYAQTTPGEEALYAMLRDAGTPEESLARRRLVMRAAQEDCAGRQRMRLILAQLGKSRFHGANAYLYRPADRRPGRPGFYRALALVPFAFLGLGFFRPAFFLGYAAMFAVNMAVYYRSSKHWMREIAAVRHIASVLACARRLKDALPQQLRDIAARLEALTRELKPIARWNALFAMQRQSDIDVITDYVKIMLQLDMLCLIRLSAFFEAHGAALRELYQLVGELDACVAIARFRGTGRTLCEPEFADEPRVRAAGLAHPLLERPVRNDFTWDGCVLITGSNASGKSTFAKAMAINAILAQSVCTCAAQAFCLPRARVMTSMALRDNTMGGESYFIVEIKSLRRILTALDERMPTLCFIDEILRGTNTVERVAASSALLEHLLGQNCLCMAATHDQELVGLLPGYRQVHFRETITENGMHFPYKILEGPSDTRNAIALLEQMRFPRPVLERADALVRRYERTRAWLPDAEEQPR